MLTRAISPPKMEKLSTIQLKQALEKIKQTQLEVLKVLRTQGEGSMANESRVKSLNDNIQANMPYIKSISHINLLKMAEITNMKKQMENERERSNQKIKSLQQQNQLLENQLAFKQRVQSQWNRQKQFLNEQVKSLTANSFSQNKNISTQIFNKQQIISYEEQLNEKTKEKMALQSQIKILQQQIKAITFEKEKIKNQFEQLIAEKAERQTNHFEADIKYAQFNQEKRMPYDEIIQEIKKISQNHDKIYQSLKTRTRITISDLNGEEEMQQSISKLLALIETNQKCSLQKMKQIDDDSVIHGYKGSDNESFREDVKKINKQLFDSENIKKELAELKNQNYTLKEQKYSIEMDLNSLRQKLINNQARLKRYQQKVQEQNGNHYKIIVSQLQSEINRIKEEKNSLVQIVKRIRENALKNPTEENELKILRNQIGSIIEINQCLRGQNENFQKVINKMNVDCETWKHQISKYEKALAQKHENLENSQKQKQYLLEQFKKIEQLLRQKDFILIKQEKQIDQLQINLQNQSQKNQNDLRSKMIEISSLRQQIDRNYQQLRDLRQMAYKFKMLEVENQNVKKKIMQINGTVIHLWDIKEIEYENVNKIISQIRLL